MSRKHANNIVIPTFTLITVYTKNSKIETTV